MKLYLAVGTLVGWLALASGCSPAAPAAALESGEASGELLVYAAASLSDAFAAVAADFEALHPGVELKLSFAGSQSLRTQLEHGARPQVFAAANEAHMQALARDGVIGDPVVFARNELVVVVPADNPAGIGSFAELAKGERIVLAGREVPAGVYAAEILATAAARYGKDFTRAVESRVVSREADVRRTLQKVVLGEADAAIVYATDARSRGRPRENRSHPERHKCERQLSRGPRARGAAPRPRRPLHRVSPVKGGPDAARRVRFPTRCASSQTLVPPRRGSPATVAPLRSATTRWRGGRRSALGLGPLLVGGSRRPGRPFSRCPSSRS